MKINLSSFLDIKKKYNNATLCFYLILITMNELNKISKLSLPESSQNITSIENEMKKINEPFLEKIINNGFWTKYPLCILLCVFTSCLVDGMEMN